MDLVTQQKAVNFWQSAETTKKLINVKGGASRLMIPMIINWKVYLLCPDTGFKTEKIPTHIFNYYKKRNL